MTEDAALVERCLSGETDAVCALVARFQGDVFGLCYRMLGHRQDAEDVSQEVFVRVFRSLRRWDPTRPLKPWVLKIAANRCRTALVQRSRLPSASDFVVEPSAIDAEGGRTELGEELQRALEQLRDDYRTCFILFYQQELSCAEIGDVLDCPEGTVKTWLHRARNELARYLKRRGYAPDAKYELHRI